MPNISIQSKSNYVFAANPPPPTKRVLALHQTGISKCLLPTTDDAPRLLLCRASRLSAKGAMSDSQRRSLFIDDYILHLKHWQVVEEPKESHSLLSFPSRLSTRFSSGFSPILTRKEGPLWLSRYLSRVHTFFVLRLLAYSLGLALCVHPFTKVLENSQSQYGRHSDLSPQDSTG